MKENGRLLVRILQTEETWQMQSPQWSQKGASLRAKMNDNLTVQCVDTARLVLLRVFAHQGARDFSEKLWLHLIQEDSSMKRPQYCLDCKISLRYLRAIQGHSGSITKRPGLMEYTLIPRNWKEYIIHTGISWNSQSFFGSGIIPGGKENHIDKQSSSHFWIHSETTQMKKHFMMKVHTTLIEKRNQDAVFWIKMSRAQDQGLQFWQTKSSAIITHATVPGDCIDRVISHDGDRAMFEILATPRPARKVALKSNWHTQQQQQQQPQHLTLEKDVHSIWKRHTIWESRAGVWASKFRCDVWYSSQWAGSHHRCILEQRSEYSRKRTSENWLEQNLYSKRPNWREDGVQQRIQPCRLRMGIVELIELKNSSIQCPSCLHHVFEGTLLCKCGKLMKPDQDVMNRIGEAFEILKAPYYRTSPTSTRRSKCGPNLRQLDQHKARDALRKATKGDRAFYFSLGQMAKWWDLQEISACSELVGRLRYVDHIVHFSIYYNATKPQRERHINLLHLRSVDENKQAPPLWQRPGIGKRKRNCQIYKIGQNNVQKKPSSSSSNWLPSPTWWSSSSWTRSWQKWHPHRWQDDKWSKKWWKRQHRTRVFNEV